MGNYKYKAADWSSYSRSVAAKSTEQIYSAKHIDKDLNPKTINIREARDSDANPETTPILVGLDVTGSMGILADQIAKNGLGLLFEELIKRRPIKTPQLAFAGIGDVNYDRAPFQITQFECDVTSMTPQLEKIWLEKGGGGNNIENYELAWYFANNYIVHDAWVKRQQKGYLFTIGDECITNTLHFKDINKIFNVSSEEVTGQISTKELYALASQQWNIYHLMVEQGNYMSIHSEKVKTSWTNIIGEKAILLSDINNLAEVIISTIQFNEGETHEDIISSWDSSSTKKVVSRALTSLSQKNIDKKTSGKIVKF